MAHVPRSKQILTTVTPRTLDDLDRYADAMEVSRADAIRSLILDGLATWRREHDAQRKGSDVFF